MDAWIRNQNRQGLRLVRNVSVKDKKAMGYTVSAGFAAPDQSTLGRYEAEERAVEKASKKKIAEFIEKLKQE